MHESLQDQLKAFEKDLSILLVRFMKICDQVEHAQSVPPGAPTPAAAAPKPPAQKPVDLRAYV